MIRNKLTVIFGFALFSTLTCQAERVPLWPEGKIPNFQPQQIAATTKEVRQPGFKREEHTMPYLEWFDAPSEKNGACMLLISGGGYKNCCDWRWIEKVAKKFTDLGYVCVSLTYRTPSPEGLPIYQSGWQDGQRAIRLVRQSAKERGFDPEKIGLLGFSAGGHLTTLLGTSALTPAYEPVDAVDEIPCHVNLAVPIYVAYALTDGLTGPNTRGGRCT
jgi:acetyl esterase/lipase